MLTKLVFGGIILVALVGAAIYLLIDLGGSSSPSARPAAEAPTTAADMESESEVSESEMATEPANPTPTVLTESEQQELALITLEEMVEADRAHSPVRGQWVAQLASKYEGVVDTTQQDEPFTLKEILDEVNEARDNPEFGDLVRVIHQGDWGKSEPGPQTMWVTVVDVDYRSRDAVVEWCEDHFSEGGDALLNVCYPRQLHLR